MEIMITSLRRGAAGLAASADAEYNDGPLSVRPVAGTVAGGSPRSGSRAGAVARPGAGMRRDHGFVPAERS